MSEKLDFIVIGGSVAGLATAIALRISGHSVLILEREAQLGSPNRPNTATGCARIPPNAYKILAEWGMEETLLKHAVVNAGFGAYKYLGTKAPSRDLLGNHTWDPELLVEARGDYMFLVHNELIKMLHQRVLAPSPPDAKIREGNVRILLNTTVASVDYTSDTPSVTLDSGKVYTADAVIGADGTLGVVRRALMEGEEVGPPEEEDEPTGVLIYSAMVPHSQISKHPELQAFYEFPESTMWLGSGCGAMTDMAGKNNRDLHFFAYTSDPEHIQDGDWLTPSNKTFSDILGKCDPLLKKLGNLAGPAACFQQKKYYELESWVSDSGRVMAIGEAAHPTVACGWHTYSIVFEDAVFLGKVFARSSDRERIPELLAAFDEHRRPRCEFLCRLDRDYIGIITVPDGPEQEGRDGMMRGNHEAGRNVWASPGVMETLLDETRMVFSYDAADDADEWWMAWGRYRDRSSRVFD